MMPMHDRPIATPNDTLSALITELGEESQQVIALINQLRLPDLTPQQQVQILSELLAAVVHLHIHCDASFQDLLVAEIEHLSRVEPS